MRLARKRREPEDEPREPFEAPPPLAPSEHPRERRDAGEQIETSHFVPESPAFGGTPLAEEARRDPAMEPARERVGEEVPPALGGMPKPAAPAGLASPRLLPEGALPQAVASQEMVPPAPGQAMPESAWRRPRDGQAAVAVPHAPVRPGAVLHVTSALRGAPPDAGIQNPAYHWPDLLDGEPPPRPDAGEGQYAVYHAIEVDVDVRITYQTLVSVRNPHAAADGKEPRVVADSRVNVQKRALLEMMDRARANADHRAHTSREALARRLARKRARVMRWPRWATPLGFGLLHTRARLGASVIHARRRLNRGLVEIPDSVFSSALRVQYHVGDRLARQALVQGLKDPTHMTQEQRSVALFLTTFAVVGAVVLLNSFFALAWPEGAAVYRRMLTEATVQFLGLFGAPFPIEPMLVVDTIAIGPYLAFTGFFVGKMLAAWVLFLLGDSLHHHIKKKMKGPRGQRVVEWLNRNCNRYGLPILILDNAPPLAPDQLMFVIAASGISFRTWMVGIAAGTVIKYVAVIAGVYIIGPERITHFFEHPFG